MNKKVGTTPLILVVGFVVPLLSNPLTPRIYAETCIPNAQGPEICVDFLDAGDPDSPDDFLVVLTDPANPDVKLFKGSLFWQVRSRVSESNDVPADIGGIKLNPSVSTADFRVKIANGSEPGAVNVKSIDLTGLGWTGGSSIAPGSRISGSLGSTFTLQENGAGEGGSANGFTIDGDVSWDITLPHAAGLTINGKFGGQGLPYHERFLFTIGDIVGGELIIGSLEDTLITLTV